MAVHSHALRVRLPPSRRARTKPSPAVHIRLTTGPQVHPRLRRTSNEGDDLEKTTDHCGSRRNRCGVRSSRVRQLELELERTRPEWGLIELIELERRLWDDQRRRLDVRGADLHAMGIDAEGPGADGQLQRGRL